MAFLKNCWYIAGWSSELGTSPVGRRILDQPVVMYRLMSGEAVALSGRCPHRFAPMRLGSVIDDQIQCPYHGLRFNATGACSFNPHGNGAAPKSIRLQKYPMIERYGAVWIWMGDPTRAVHSLLPEYAFLEDPGLARIQGYIHTKANYELMSDNIMDLGHVDFLHGGSLGCGATARAKTTVSRSANSVRCDRWMANELQGPLMYWAFSEEPRPVDAWLDVVWEPPSNMMITFGMTEVGGDRAAGHCIPAVHLMTPETETSTHYFWANTRSFKVDDHAFSTQFSEGITATFTREDTPMIEAQQEMMGTTDLWSLRPALLSGDTAPVMARRILEKLICNEATGEISNRDPVPSVEMPSLSA